MRGSGAQPQQQNTTSNTDNCLKDSCSVNIITCAAISFKGLTTFEGETFMSNPEEWREFLRNLCSNAIAAHRNSNEYQYLRQQQEHIDEMLTTNLSADDRAFVEEVLFELGVIAERETEVVYQQGLRDCIWLLKNLGFLA